jgi:YegS/Rv2252/BmrU family lipid kinase
VADALPRSMRALIVINPISGPRRHRSIDDCTALARGVLGRHGFEVEVAVTRARGDARRLSERARADGAGLVVAWGGDGTINEVGSALVGSDTVLGIVPGGSGNGLARDLGIPLEPEPALEVVATGRTRRIDSGRIDDRTWFFNVAGVGLDALVARHIARPDSQRGLAGYARVTFGELPWYRPQHYEIECNGRIEAHRAVFIAFANSRQYGNDAQIAPAASLDDGQLDLVVVEAQPLWRILMRIPDLFKGRLRPGRGLRMEKMTSIVVRAERPIAFHADGEPGLGGAFLTVEVEPRSLIVSSP